MCKRLLICQACGHAQYPGDWEDAMDARSRAMGMKGFTNIKAPAECLKCGLTDLKKESEEACRIRQDAEAKRVAEEERHEAESNARWKAEYEAKKQKQIQTLKQRRAAAQCVLCGRALHRFQKIFGSTKHFLCTEYRERLPCARDRCLIAGPNRPSAIMLSI
jgi:hypothetical protein